MPATSPALTWIASYIDIREDGVRLAKPRVTATQISLPSDKSFASYDQAITRLREPLPSSDVNVFWDQVHFDALLEYSIRSDQSSFAIRPGLEHLASRVTTVLQFETPDGVTRVYQLTGDPGLMTTDPNGSSTPAARRR